MKYIKIKTLETQFINGVEVQKNLYQPKYDGCQCYGDCGCPNIKYEPVVFYYIDGIIGSPLFEENKIKEMVHRKINQDNVTRRREIIEYLESINIFNLEDLKLRLK